MIWSIYGTSFCLLRKIESHTPYVQCGKVFKREDLLIFSDKPPSVKANIWNHVIYQGEAILWQLAQRCVTDATVVQHRRATNPNALICHLSPFQTGNLLYWWEKKTLRSAAFAHWHWANQRQSNVQRFIDSRQWEQWWFNFLTSYVGYWYLKCFRLI